MARSNFTETTFRCARCGTTFKALSGPNAPAVVLCGDCGLSGTASGVRDGETALRRARAMPPAGRRRRS